MTESTCTSRAAWFSWEKKTQQGLQMNVKTCEGSIRLNWSSISTLNFSFHTLCACLDWLVLSTVRTHCTLLFLPCANMETFSFTAVFCQLQHVSFVEEVAGQRDNRDRSYVRLSESNNAVRCSSHTIASVKCKVNFVISSVLMNTSVETLLATT